MLKNAGVFLVLVFAVVVVAGPGLPVQPTYATSDSMAPAIDEGDAYIVVESENIQSGDIILFYSTRTGEYTTHRIVEETEAGFITKGDNSPSTDQDSGFPPVKRSAIVGKVVEVGGQPITISGARPLVQFVQDNPLAIVGFAALVLLGPELWAARSNQHRPARDVIFAHDIIHPLFVAGAIIGFILILWGASTHQLTWVAMGQATSSTHTIILGEPTTASVFVETYTPPFTAVIVEAEGLTVLDRTIHGSTIELDVRVPAVEARGPYRTEVNVYPYPATLPNGVLRSLHNIHWFLAAVGSMVPVFAVAGILYGATVDGKTRLRSPRSRWLRRLGGRLYGD